MGKQAAMRQASLSAGQSGALINRYPSSLRMRGSISFSDGPSCAQGRRKQGCLKQQLERGFASAASIAESQTSDLFASSPVSAMSSRFRFWPAAPRRLPAEGLPAEGLLAYGSLAAACLPVA